MELREWQYINKPAASSNTASVVSTSSNTGFKKRLAKLIRYHGDNLPVDVDYLFVGLLTKDRLGFAEQYDDGQVVEYKISIDPASEDWQVRIFVNRQLDEELKGTGWPELLKTLRPYIVVPETRELEYKNLLTEWVAMNNKTPSTGGYKKRFEKLIKYHIDHASSELESITYKDIKEYSFHLSEHYNTGNDEFDRTIIVSVNKYTDEFYLSIFVDGKVVYQNDYEGYEKVLEILTDTYMFLPNEGTSDYDDLLTESLNEWQLMNPPKASQSASATSSKTNKEKFAELVAYMQKHKDSSVIFTSVNGPNDTGFEYEEQRAFTNGDEYNLSLEVECKFGDLFFIHLDMDGQRIATKSAVGWEDLLLKIKTHFHVPKTGSPEHKSLTESFSIADDFKLYENLWD